MEKQIKQSKLKPLSFTKYYRNNMKGSLALTLALVLSVFMIIIFQMVIFGVNEPSRLGDLGVSEYMTRAYPGDKGIIDNSIIEKIKKNPALERIIPMYQQDMDYSHFFGTCNVNIYFIRYSDMDYVLKKLGLTLIKGRMPVPGRKEILLDSRIANNKNKELGDYIGKEDDPKEKMPGKYKIVGILNGGCILGLSPVDDNQTGMLRHLLIAPKDGKIDMLNMDFEGISTDKAYFWTKKKAEDNYNKTSKSLNTIFGVMSIAVVFVMSFAAGNSSYAQYFARRFEFGVLQSIGYTKASVLLRAAKEIALLNFIGFTGGLILSLGTGIVLQKVFFEPHGYPFMLLQSGGIIKAITIPICTILFGLIPAGWLLSKIDPMTVIEKFE